METKFRSSASSVCALYSSEISLVHIFLLFIFLFSLTLLFHNYIHIINWYSIFSVKGSELNVILSLENGVFRLFSVSLLVTRV